MTKKEGREGRVVTDFVTAIPLSASKMDGEGEKTLKQKKAVSYRSVTNSYLPPYSPLFMRDSTSTNVGWK